MKFEIEYFHPRVKKAINEWPESIKAEYALLVDLLIDNGPSLGMPESRAMGGGLFELRPKGQAGAGRAFYCFKKGRKVIILHAFIKKTPRTPLKELQIGRKRLKEASNG